MQRLAFLLDCVRYLQKYYSITTAIFLTLLLNFFVTLPLYFNGDTSLSTAEGDRIVQQLSQCEIDLSDKEVALTESQKEILALQKMVETQGLQIEALKLANAEAQRRHEELLARLDKQKQQATDWPW